jgi:hypothetical protein
LLLFQISRLKSHRPFGSPVSKQDLSIADGQTRGVQLSKELVVPGRTAGLPFSTGSLGGINTTSSTMRFSRIVSPSVDFEIFAFISKRS